MVKTMKRGLSLMFVLSLLVSMLVIPAKAAPTPISIPSKGTKYVTIYTDRSFLGLKTTVVTFENTSRDTIVLYQKVGSAGYVKAGILTPGGPTESLRFSAKANGKSYTFKLERAWGRGDAIVNYTVNNGYGY